jgi:acetolactate synthase-1/2/3 large subunit
MLEALSSHTPIVHIGGAAQLYELGSGALQDVDTLSVMRTCSKWSEKVSFTNRIADQLDTAFRYSMSGLPGPVYLEIPVDILYGQADADKVKITPPSTDVQPAGHPDDIKAAAKLLAEAKAPSMLIGNFALYSRKHGEAVGELAHYLKMPLASGTLGRGLFIDEDDILCKVGPASMAKADVIITFGVYADSAFGKLQPPVYNADAKIIQVNTDAYLIGYNRPADIGIVGGTGIVAELLLQEIKKLRQPATDTLRIEQLEKAVDASLVSLNEAIKEPGSPVRPGRCAGEVNKFLNTTGRDWTLVPDGGDGGAWINTVAKAHRPTQIMGIVGNGTIGLAPGVAIGTYFAGKKPILLYSGDGSFGYYCMEFTNFIKYGLPIVVVISNDAAWGMVKGFEHVIRPRVYRAYEDKYHDSLAVNLAFIHYEKLAEMFGGYGELVEDPDQIVPAIERAIASGKPAIVNVRVEDILKDGYSTRTKVMATAFAPYCKDYE